MSAGAARNSDDAGANSCGGRRASHSLDHRCGCGWLLLLLLHWFRSVQELEEHAEAQVVTLLRHVDAALYASASPSGSPAFVSPVPSPNAAAAAAGPVRFPHRKPLLSYMDECSQWSQAFPHFRVDGISCAPPLCSAITAVPTAAAAAADTASHSSSHGGSSRRQGGGGRATRKAAALFAQMGHAMPPAAPTAAAAAATIAASSTAAIVTPVDPASLSLRGSAISRVAAPAKSASATAFSIDGDEAGEILYLDGAGFEETLALDHSDAGCGDPAFAGDLLGSSSPSDSSAPLPVKASHRGMPPLTPSRFAEWEAREAATEKVWRDRTLGPQGGGQKLVRAIIAILTQARDKHAQAMAEAAKLAPSSPLSPQQQQQPQQQEDEGDGDVLFFDGDQSMPNPFLSSAAATTAAATCSPRTAKLRALLGLDAAGHFKPAPPPRAAAIAGAEDSGGGGDMVRIRMHSASAGSASARSRRRKQQMAAATAAAFAEDSDNDDSDTELAASFAADPFAAADAEGPVHKKSRAALGLSAAAAGGAAGNDDEDSSFADPLSYRSPSVYSAYSLTHSSRRSRSAHGHAGGGQGHAPKDAADMHAASSRENPLSRSSSRIGGTPLAASAAAAGRAGQQYPRSSFESMGWPASATSPDSTDSEEAEYEHSRESVVAPMPLPVAQPQPPPATATRSSPLSPPRRIRSLATTAAATTTGSPTTGGRNITPPLLQQVASPSKAPAAAAARTAVVSTPPKPHRPSSSAAPFRPASSRNGTNGSPTGAVANGSAAASSSLAAASASSSQLSPERQARRSSAAPSSASASASAARLKRATVPASLPFNLALIAQQNALQQQHAGAGAAAPPASATASSAQMHSAAAIANALQMRGNLSSPPPLPPTRSSSKMGAGPSPLPVLRLPFVANGSSAVGASAGQVQRPHTVQSTRSGQPSMAAAGLLANGSIGGPHTQTNQDASARSVQAPSRRLTQTNPASDAGMRSSAYGPAPVYLNSTLPQPSSLPPSHPGPLRMPRAVSALPRSSHAGQLSSTQAVRKLGVPSSLVPASNHSRASEEKAKEVSLRASTPGGGHERSSSSGGGGGGGGSFDAYLQRPFSSSSIRAAAHAQLHGAAGRGSHPLSSASAASGRSVAAPSGSFVTVSSTHGLVRGSHGFGVNPSAPGAAAAAKAHLAAAQAVYASSAAASPSHGNRSAMHSPVPLHLHAPPARTHSMAAGNSSGSGGAGSSAKKKGASNGHQQPTHQTAPHRPHGMAPPVPKNKSSLAVRVPNNPGAVTAVATT